MKAILPDAAIMVKKPSQFFVFVSDNRRVLE